MINNMYKIKNKQYDKLFKEKRIMAIDYIM